MKSEEKIVFKRFGSWLALRHGTIVEISPRKRLAQTKITPKRIAKYAEVQSCYLMSGGYDLLVIVEGTNLREIATFMSEKLSTVQGVISTATHFMLKPYKEQGILMRHDVNEERLAVTP